MRSEAVGNEQKHANVKVIEHEYQTLTWEQSSFADGRSDQLPGGWLGAQTCIHCWLQNFHHNSLHFITLVTCFLSQIPISLFFSLLFFFPPLLHALPLPLLPSYKSFPLVYEVISSILKPHKEFKAPLNNCFFFRICIIY